MKTKKAKKKTKKVVTKASGTTLGNKLVRARKKLNITQVQLSKLIAISPMTIVRIEKGFTASTKTETKVKAWLKTKPTVVTHTV